MREIRILGISGSLRAVSSHRSLLAVAAGLTPAGAVLEISSSIGNLSLFNPDLADSAPESVLHFREEIAAADAVLIASPEYAHGVPGAFKNALDWVVGCAELGHKPVVLLNAAPRAVHAQAALAEIVVTMNLNLLVSLPVPVPRNATPDSIAADSATASLLRQALTQIRHVAEQR